MLIILILLVASIGIDGEVTNFNKAKVCSASVVTLRKIDPQKDVKFKDIKTISKELDTAKSKFLLDAFGTAVQKAGEIGSIIIGIAAVTAAVTAAVATVLVPGLGIFAIMLGIALEYKKSKAGKKEMMKMIDQGMLDLTNRVNQRFEEMMEYIDETTVILEKSLLNGEYRQMYGYLTDCLEEENEKSARRECITDRCSYVKAGFHKFAIHYDDLVNNKDTKQNYAAMSRLEIKRIQSNLIMFELYVSTLLLPCESALFIEKLLRKAELSGTDELVTSDITNHIESQVIRDAVTKYHTNAHSVIMEAYMDHKQAWELGENKEDIAMVVDAGLSSDKKSLQCRTRMNKFNSDTCDFEGFLDKSIKDVKVQCYQSSIGYNKVLQTYKKSAEEIRKQFNNDEKEMQSTLNDLYSAFKEAAGKITPKDLIPNAVIEEEESSEKVVHDTERNIVLRSIFEKYVPKGPRNKTV